MELLFIQEALLGIDNKNLKQLYISDMQLYIMYLHVKCQSQTNISCIIYCMLAICISVFQIYL